MYTIYSMQDSFNNKKKAIKLYQEFLSSIGCESEMIGLNSRDMIDRNMYKTFNDLISKESEEKLPKRSYTGQKTRIEYYKLVRQIEEKIDEYFNAKQLPLERKARLCCHLRNLLKVKARDSIKVPIQARNFMTTLPVRTWEYLANKYNSNWEEIIAASMRTDPSFDKYIGERD